MAAAMSGFTEQHHFKVGRLLMRRHTSSLILLIIGVLTSLHPSNPSLCAAYVAIAENQVASNTLLTTPVSLTYEISVDEVRGATTLDGEEAVALSRFTEAEALRAKWDQQSLQEAINKYTEASRFWKLLNNREDAALALQRIGDTYFILSEYRQALSFYNEALLLRRKGIKDQRAEFETLNSIGYAYIYLGENYKALELFNNVLAKLKTVQSSDQEPALRLQQAQALNNIGEVYYSLGDLKKALGYFNSSLAIWKEVTDRRGQALAHLNIGYTYADLGDLQNASEHYSQSLAFWEDIGDQRGVALSSTAIGGIHSLLGEKQLALDFHKRAMQIFHVLGNSQGEAAALNGIAQVYEDMNQPNIAFDNYNKALQLYEKIGNRDYVALNMYYLGRVYYSMGKTDQAVDYFQRSVQLSRQVGDKRFEAHALKGLGTVLESLGHKEQAMNRYKKAWELYRQSGDQLWQARTLNNIGYLYYSSGEKQKAMAYYRQALALSQAVKERQEEISTYYNMAIVEHDQGNSNEALAHITASINLIESLRTKIASKDLRTSYFASVHHHYELYVDLLMQLHKRHPDKGYAAAALQASEHARARSLLEELISGGVDLRQGVSPELLVREEALRRQLDVKLEYQTRLLNGKHTDSQATEIDQEVSNLTTQYQEILSEIRRQSPRYALLTQPQLLRVEDIQAEVQDEDTLLLEYALGKQRSYLWAVTPNSITGYELPGRATIEELAGKVYELLIARQPIEGEEPAQYRERVLASEMEYRQHSARLSRLLLGQVAAQLQTKRLLIICEGRLEDIPFEALPIPETSMNDTGQNLESASSRDENILPLVINHEIVRLPSASVLAALRREKVTNKPPSKLIAILADPVFDKYDSRIQASSSSATEPTQAQNSADLNLALRDVGETDGELNVPRLPSTLREAKSIMDLIPAEEGMMATGFQASRTVALSGDLSQYRIVHFATHGIFNRAHPELSGIILSLVDERGQSQNGFLRVHDLYNLHLPADLVVLSACRTGLGRNVTGEGVIGITRGFICAGTKSIVASLWKVDDEATAELMKNFYSAMLKDGLPPAAALRAAKITMWKQERWHAPYYWAAFVLQGEYRQTPIYLAGADQEMPLKIFIISLIILAAGIYIVKRIRRNHLT